MPTNRPCRNWSKWRAGRHKRSARARHAAEIRWQRHHAAQPTREIRRIAVTIRDSHRPMTVLRATQHDQGGGQWSRLRIQGSHGRPVSRHGLAMRIAAALL